MKLEATMCWLGKSRGNGVKLKKKEGKHAIRYQSRSRNAKALALNRVYTI